MVDSGVSRGVVLRLKSTPLRSVVGLIFFVPLAWLVIIVIVSIPRMIGNPAAAATMLLYASADLFIPLAMAWIGQRFFREIQTVTVERETLVVRSSSWIGPSLPRRIGMDRIAGRRFEVRRYKADQVNSEHRTSIRSRLLMAGDGGSVLASAGASLTVAEAEDACTRLNRFIDSPVSSEPGRNDLPV